MHLCRVQPILRRLMTAASLAPILATRLPASVHDLDALSQPQIDAMYRPFLLPAPALDAAPDWTADLELDTISSLLRDSSSSTPMKLLVLYGSLRQRSFSRLTAFEMARILHQLSPEGKIDVRVYDPAGLPMKDDVSDQHEKVQELRALAEWSNGQVWVCPEQHGALTGVFKNQLDWIPLSVGSVRPTQGRTVAVNQISGGSQSFNTVNSLRLLARWMRMICIPNQSSLPQAWKQFTKDDRLMPSSNRDRLVDVCEELVKFTLLFKPHKPSFDDRYSEREERRAHGRLRTQAETVAAKDLADAAPKGNL